VRTIVIVGASLAGLRAAEELRRQGFDGTVTVIGDEPHSPYDRPPLSKQVLSGAWDLNKFWLDKIPSGSTPLRQHIKATAVVTNTLKDI
jgi:NADPH-dependent 2,4-dienoyl-CoA reductase/sulfur reductase-like enzyme